MLRKASVEEKKYLKIMFAFAQGEISTDDFIYNLKAKRGLVEFILSDKIIPDARYEEEKFSRIVGDDFRSYESRYDLYRII